MLAGMAQGGQAGQGLMAGNIPSVQSPGGAPPIDIDRATAAFNQCHDCLMKLTTLLHQLRDDIHSNQVAKLAYELKQTQLSRRKQEAKAQADNTQSPMTSAIAGLN